MQSSESRLILWVDDDGPPRFPYESFMLREKGWDISWALNVEEAASLLSSKRFDAVLLDQMLPAGKAPYESVDVWGGCLLLYWLRKKPRPLAAPRLVYQEIFSRFEPDVRNENVPVIFVSAFYDSEVQAAIKNIERSVRWMAKPIDFDEMARLFEEMSVSS